MSAKYLSLSHTVLDRVMSRLSPIAVVDLKGIIAWSNRDKKENVPCLQVGLPINNIHPDLSQQAISINKEISIQLNRVEYTITIESILLEDNFQGFILLFDNSEHVAVLKENYNWYRNKYETLYDVANSHYLGTIYINTDGIIEIVNDMFAGYVGIPKEKLIGNKIQNFNIDPGLMEVVRTGKPDLLHFYPQPKLIAQRQPVERDGKLIGVYGRYISLDMKAIRKNIFEAEEYINVISRLQARDVMFNINQFILELNSYKDEFQKVNSTSVGIDNIKGNSTQIRTIKNMILMVSNSPSSVLITGESGSGKELVAQAIHFHSDRSSYPFIKVNCAAIPENLMESELFGYVDGAFTGARKGGKMGKFELANQGTIFLDEIGDMPLSMQAKLLRVLQEREIERVGANNPIPVNVRIISATNKDLNVLVDEGMFRLDLYYRLNVVKINIPPLRERTEDIAVIAQHAIKELNKKLCHNITNISPQGISLLMHYNWPGNIRELVNVLETAMNFCQDTELTPDNLRLVKIPSEEAVKTSKQNLKASINTTEKIRLKAALESNNGDRKATAAMLDVSRTTLYRLMKKHDLL